MGTLLSVARGCTTLFLFVVCESERVVFVHLAATTCSTVAQNTSSWCSESSCAFSSALGLFSRCELSQAVLCEVWVSTSSPGRFSDLSANEVGVARTGGRWMSVNGWGFVLSGRRSVPITFH